MTQKSPLSRLPLEPEEAQSLQQKCKQCATDITKNEADLRLFVFEFFERKGPKALDINEAEFRKSICARSGGHRSTVNRQYLAALTDFDLGLLVSIDPAGGPLTQARI